MKRTNPVLEELRAPRTCLKCQLQYTEESNMATWKCKQHACLLQPCGKTGTYYFPCCGENTWTISNVRDYWRMKPGSGCVPCDHRSNTLAPYNDADGSGELLVPETVVNHFKIPKEKFDVHEHSFQRGLILKVFRYDRKNKVYEQDDLPFE